MAPNDSRAFLPLPTLIFSRSTSNLRSDSTFNFDISRRPKTAHTSYSVPDLTLTALPQHQPPLPPLPPLSAINIEPPSPKKLTKSPPQSPTKTTNKGSGWRRLGRKVKRALQFGRQGKRGSKEMNGKGPGRILQIGSPTDFQHIETHGVGPLRPSAPPSGISRAVMAGDGGWVKRDGEWKIEEGMRVMAGARRDREGTAVEDDGASEWEDCEETRIFTWGR